MERGSFFCPAFGNEIIYKKYGLRQVQSVMNKKIIQCACLGTVFNLPMSTVTIIEDLLMVGISAFMLLI